MYISSGFRSTYLSRFLALSSAFLISSITSISAYSVGFESGDWAVSVDTTATTGLGWRVDNQDTQIIGLSGDPAGLPGSGSSITGTAFSENSDDGNQMKHSTGPSISLDWNE